MSFLTEMWASISPGNIAGGVVSIIGSFFSKIILILIVVEIFRLVGNLGADKVKNAIEGNIKKVVKEKKEEHEEEREDEGLDEEEERKLVQLKKDFNTLRKSINKFDESEIKAEINDIKRVLTELNSLENQEARKTLDIMKIAKMDTSLKNQIEADIGNERNYLAALNKVVVNVLAVLATPTLNPPEKAEITNLLDIGVNFCDGLIKVNEKERAALKKARKH